MNHPKKGNPEVTPKEWTCDICNRKLESPDHNIFRIGDYYEFICAECYDRGLMWCIREAWKWRSQIAIDVLRKPKNE